MILLLIGCRVVSVHKTPKDFLARVAKAARRVKAKLEDPALREFYEVIALERENQAHLVAVRDWMVQPTFKPLDLSEYKGKVTFIRFVRQSGRITLTANDKFLIGKKYKWQYVMAKVDVAKKKLSVICQGKHIRSFDYH